MQSDGEIGRVKLRDLIQNKIDDSTFEGKYQVSVRRRVLFILSLIGVTLIISLLSIGLGAVDIPIRDILKVFFHPILPNHIGAPSEDYYADFIFKGRLPRMCLVILTGFTLGVAGMLMQSLLRNPLVSPFTLGVSTAASFGAALSIVMGFTLFGSLMNVVLHLGPVKFNLSSLVTVFFAFMFAMLSIAFILILTKNKNTSRSTIILSGVVIGYLFQAGIMAAKYFSDDSQLREITLWIMGSTGGASWGIIVLLLPIVAICSMYIFKMSMDVNTLSAGDDVASSLGVDVHRLRRKGLIVATFMTAACLAFTGVIGFIGLMAPHICRMLIGNDSRYLMPAAGLMGVVILGISDLFSRMIIRPGELPVGIILYVVGGIFFIWMITNKKWSQRL